MYKPILVNFGWPNKNWFKKSQVDLEDDIWNYYDSFWMTAQIILVEYLFESSKFQLQFGSIEIWF